MSDSGKRTRSMEQDFCPLLRDRCRSDCTWHHTFVTISEDGVSKACYCAVSVIANELCDMNEDESLDAM